MLVRRMNFARGWKKSANVPTPHLGHCQRTDGSLELRPTTAVQVLLTLAKHQLDFSRLQLFRGGHSRSGPRRELERTCKGTVGGWDSLRLLRLTLSPGTPRPNRPRAQCAPRPTARGLQAIPRRLRGPGSSVRLPRAARTARTSAGPARSTRAKPPRPPPRARTAPAQC